MNRVRISGAQACKNHICFNFSFNTLRPGQNGSHFTDETLKCILLNGNVRIQFKSLLMFVPNGPINNIPALVQLMAWRRPGAKSLSEPMVVRLSTHIYLNQWWLDYRHIYTSLGINELTVLSSHNFAHAMTAQLSWHVQNCDMIRWIFFK